MDRSTTPAGRASGVPRRTAIAGTGVLAVTGAALAACGDGGGGGGGGEAPAKGTVIGKASDVQVGGGTVFKDAETVVTQPAEGEFKAFSAICTHQPLRRRPQPPRVAPERTPRAETRGAGPPISGRSPAS